LIKYLVIIFLILSIVLPSVNPYLNKSNNSLILKYNSIIELGLHGTYNCLLILNVTGQKVKLIDIVGDIDGSTKRTLYIIIDNWLKHLNLYERVRSNEHIYVSINGKIVKAYVIRSNGNIEYRESKTGLYVGGVESFIVTLETYRVFKYFVKIVTFLALIEPKDYINNLDIVEIPVNEIRILLLLSSFAILLLAVNALIKWEHYRIT